ncbi:MAG: circularly permuted type 2 ATP-grasp protein [Candidatus Acidiferrales bacterium]
MTGSPQASRSTSVQGASEGPASRQEPLAAKAWHRLLRPDVELSPEYCAELNARMRAEKLKFGDRVHCPFLRPFFLTREDDRRVREVSEAIAVMGERIVKQSLADAALLAQAALSPDEERLVRISAGYGTSSTASRLDAFLLPDSLQFAEYNAESPAGPGYAETLAEVFLSLPVMKRFEESYHVRKYETMKMLLDALLTSYREWGGSASPPVIGIVDWREVPTWSEFEILQARFEREGVPTIVSDPRDLLFDGKNLTAQGRKIDLLYRRVLINDILARPAECEALVKAYASGAVCMANALTCKIPHKKAFFAVLTDERNASLFSDAERELIRRHIPWTRLLADTKTNRDGESFGLLEYVRRRRQDFVLKPNDEYGGTGVTLGWENDERAWDAALNRALADREHAWVVQERIAIRREVFPMQTANGVEMRDMLVDLAPYLFRGRMAGFLTRLSSTGLANVTSGGGQVPAMVVEALG